MFQNIVALEKRHLMRSGQSSTLVIVSLGKEAAPATDSRRLERILLEGLRLGDPVARLEAGSYILMLAGVDKKNAQLVINRLDSSFHKVYRHSRARLTYQIAVLRYWSIVSVFSYITVQLLSKKIKNRDHHFRKNNRPLTAAWYS